MKEYPIFLIKAVAVVLLLTLLQGCEKKSVAVDKAFPDLKLQNLDGSEMKVSDLQGKFVVLKLWATWCQICIETEPQFKAFIQKLDSNEVVVAAISVDKDINMLQEYLLDHPSAQLQLIDRNMEQSNKLLGVNMIPQVFILDRQGVLRYQFTGRTLWADEHVQMILKMAKL